MAPCASLIAGYMLTHHCAALRERGRLDHSAARLTYQSGGGGASLETHMPPTVAGVSVPARVCIGFRVSNAVLSTPLPPPLLPLPRSLLPSPPLALLAPPRVRSCFRTLTAHLGSSSSARRPHVLTIVRRALVHSQRLYRRRTMRVLQGSGACRSELEDDIRCNDWPREA